MLVYLSAMNAKRFSAALLCAPLFAGCQPAMSIQAGTRMTPPPETISAPLRFARHDFGAHCYNTLACSVVYDQAEFTRSPSEEPDKPSGPPESADYKERWGGASYLGVRNFPPPAEVLWTSLNGQAHETQVDISAIFKDELIWHKVPKQDMADFYEGPVAGSPDIFLEVNDRTINVYSKMLIPMTIERVPGNKNSDYRADLFLVWTRTY